LKFNGLVQCGEHGQAVPGYIVCQHVIEGCAVAHYCEAVPGELGEALCAICHAEARYVEAMRAIDADTPMHTDHLRLICSACLTRLMGPWEG
jgi:hypothetical protein